MKKLSIFFFILLLCSSDISAQNRFKFKGGINYTTFRNVSGSKYQPGCTLGFSREWNFPKSINNASIEMAIHFAMKKSVLKNKLIVSGTDVRIDLEDIHCSLGFIEIPLKINYYVGLDKNFKLLLTAGPSLSICILDNSYIVPIRFICDTNEECRDHKFDYDSDEDLPPDILYKIANSGLGYDLGFGIVWSKITLECHYQRSLSSIDNATGILLDEDYHTLVFSFSISL